MIAGSTRNIGYNFALTTYDESGNSTIVYFDPDSGSVQINILDGYENLIRNLDLSDFTHIGSVVGQNYNIKYVPALGDGFIEIKCTNNGDAYRDLLAVNVQDVGQSLPDGVQGDNFFIRS